MQVHVRETLRQEVAATATESFFVKQAGNILVAKFAAGAIAAVGESMTVDVHKNAATILTAPYVYDNPDDPNTWFDASLDAAEVAVAEGDMISVIRTYAAGGGPTPLSQNEVVVELGP